MTAVTQIYTMMVHEAEEGGYWAEIAELPGCVTQGETLDVLRINMREAMEAVLERDTEDVQLAEVAPTETYLLPSQQFETWTGIGA